MPIITFANSKGGSGKTTAALLLATELARGSDVTLIARHPLTAWAALPEKPKAITVVTSGGERAILDEIADAAARTPFVIIDLEGVASRMTSFAMSQSDLVIVPAQEQQQDVAAAIDVIAELHRDMRASRRTITRSLMMGLDWFCACSQLAMVCFSAAVASTCRIMMDEESTCFF